MGNPERSQSWSAWARRGSIAMAALAVVSLGATVITSQHALSEASDVVIKGEGDALLATLTSDLAEETSPASAPALERELASNQAAGLRYVAIVDREGTPIAEAGRAVIGGGPSRPGESRVEGRRVRVTGLLFPPRRGMRSPAHAEHGERANPPFPPPLFGPRGERPVGPALLVAELEPPVIATLRRDLARIAFVAALASAVLLAFAIAWSRSARRLTELEARAAREQRLVALGSMSSVMAHELRNPLASLKGHAQLLVEDLEDASDAKKRAKAERVVAEAERMEKLTTTLLEFVRDAPLERAAIAPADLVARSLEDLPAGSSSRVVIDVADAPASLDVDASRLARAVHNLVDNALQAEPEGTVRLRVARDGSGVVIVVRDRGPGLPAGAEAKIFEPFVTTRVRGTGLGLAVARRIAEQHDGTLTAANDPEGGAVFTLRLPDRAASS